MDRHPGILYGQPNGRGLRDPLSAQRERLKRQRKEYAELYQRTSELLDQRPPLIHDLCRTAGLVFGTYLDQAEALDPETATNALGEIVKTEEDVLARLFQEQPDAVHLMRHASTLLLHLFHAQVTDPEHVSRLIGEADERLVA